MLRRVPGRGQIAGSARARKRDDSCILTEGWSHRRRRWHRLVQQSQAI